MLEDQPQPVVGVAEFSTDGGETWSPLAGATLSGAVKLRLKVTGPVTAASLSLGGNILAQGTADGSFDGPGITLEAAVDFSDETATHGLTLAVSAQGRNNDPAADDDVASEVTFTAEPVPPVEPTPGPTDGGATPQPGVSEEPAPTPTATKQGSLASTGADLGVLALAGIALAAGASTLVAKRVRSTRH